RHREAQLLPAGRQLRARRRDARVHGGGFGLAAGGLRRRAAAVPRAAALSAAFEARHRDLHRSRELLPGPSHGVKLTGGRPQLEPISSFVNSANGLAAKLARPAWNKPVRSWSIQKNNWSPALPPYIFCFAVSGVNSRRPGVKRDN